MVLELRLQSGEARKQRIMIRSRVCQTLRDLMVFMQRAAGRAGTGNERVVDGFSRLERRLLGDIGELQARLAPDRAVVQCLLARDDRKQRRLAGSIATN